MASRKVIPAFAEPEEIDEAEVAEETPRVAAPKPSAPADDMITARVKGTWKMYWGRTTYDFIDGKRYRLPRDLYNYLVQHSNIYDTV